MRIRVLDGKKFATILMNVEELVDTIHLVFTEEGMSINAIDKAHVCFLDCTADIDGFDYGRDIKGVVSIDVDTTFLAKVLKKIGKGEISLEIDETKSILNIASVTDDHERKFSIPLIDMEYNTPNTPHVEWTHNFEMPVSLFKDVLGDMTLIKPLGVRFNIGEDGVLINAITEMGEKVEIKYNPEDWVYSEEPFYTSFSLEHLNTISKFALNDTITISVGASIPGLFTFEDNLEVYKCSLLLAPRIEEEDMI